MKSIWVSIIIFLSGCAPSHFRQSVRIGPDDWTLFGGSIERTNVANSILSPPLAVVWEYDASAGFSPYSGAVADSFLFVGNLQGEIHTVQIATGKVMGVYDFGSAIIGTPVIENDRMFVALTKDEESLVCYTLLTGNIEWRAKIGEIETSPLLVGTHLFVTTLKGTLVCVDKKTGEIVWQYNVPVHKNPKMIFSSPASDGKLIVFGCDDGALYTVGLDDGKLRWSAATGRSILASPSISSGKIFFGSLDSMYYALDLETGKQLWKQRLGSKIYGSQSVSANYVYVGTAGGEIFCLNVLTGAIIWNAAAKSVINSAPLLSGNILYVGSLDKTLSAFDAESGKLVWQYKTEGRIKTMPIISKGFLFLFAEDKSVIAFKHSDH